VVGNQTRVKVVKNKLAPPFKQVEFDIMYGEGVSKMGEILDLGVKAGIVEKSGAWFSYDSQRLGQGRENSKAFPQGQPRHDREDRGGDPPELRPDRRADSRRISRARRRRRRAGGRVGFSELGSHDPGFDIAGAADVELPTSSVPVLFCVGRVTNMTRLILTADASAAGGLQIAGRADIVIPLEPRLIGGPLPSDAELMARLAPRNDTKVRFALAGLSIPDETPGECRKDRERSRIDRVLRTVRDGLNYGSTPCRRHNSFSFSFWISYALMRRLSRSWPCSKRTSPLAVNLRELFPNGSHRPSKSRTSISKPPARPGRPIDSRHRSSGCLLDKNISSLPQLRQDRAGAARRASDARNRLGATEMRMLELIAAD